jgi:predicted Zn finger-like uncharacterized protein
MLGWADYNRYMNRITRCPSCATVYQVCDVQLQQARGWLRCSHCAHVFDSTGLVLDWGPSIASGPPAAAVGFVPVVAIGLVNGEPCATPLGNAERIDLDAFLHTPDPSASSRPASEALASFEQALASFKMPPLQEPGVGLPTGAGQSSPEDEPPVALAMPKFPPKSVGWEPLATVGLACVLLLQLIFVQRSAIVAHWPAIAPGLERACWWMGCQVEPLRDPKALVIEGSSMVQRDSQHVFSWTLRNTARWAVGVPAVEISLRDAQDQVLLRRVVHASEWGGPASLAPGQADSAQLAVQMDPALPVSGYRLLSFYP